MGKPAVGVTTARKRGRPKGSGREAIDASVSNNNGGEAQKEGGAQGNGENRKRGRPKRSNGGGTADVGVSNNNNEEKPQEELGERGNGGKQKNVTKPKSHKNDRITAVRLAEKPKLTREDLMCPICWSTLYEPITLPCNHSLCEVCFRKHVAETSLSCPCCRLRLSVWCRQAMKANNKIIDEELWTRIKAEFPKLVDARRKGEDSQNIMDDSEDEVVEAEDSFVHDTSSKSVLDGTLCENPGEIKEELQKMMIQHQKDMEVERQREETASAGLIKQIQDEEGVQKSSEKDFEQQDFLLAQKLQKEFEEEDRRQRSSRRSSIQQGKKSLPQNLMNQWMNTHSPDICELPLSVQSKVKPLGTSLSSNFIKGKLNGKKPNSTKKKPSATVTSLEVSKASQRVMSNFLSSQNQLASPDSSSSPASVDSSQPCCSKSLAPVHDVNLSAFSPTKPFSNRTLIIPAESLSIPISSPGENFSPIVNRTTEEPGTSTKTPDSINSEVNRHFRPIRGAPKTPPRRRPDGTFLPEPRLMRTTPIKPGSSSFISAYIRSPLKQMPDESRPSCATMEKRISNDSGRASDDSRSPEVDGIGESPTISPKGSDHASVHAFGQSFNNERGCISEDYRVTPYDNPKTPENSKKRFHNDDNEMKVDIKKIKVEMVELTPVTPEKCTKGDVKEEPESPSLLNEPFGHVPLKFDIACSQGIITIDEEDEEYVNREAKALDEFQQRAKQEAEDRALAVALQRSLNKGIRSPRDRNSKEKYSLRTWLKESPNQTNSGKRQTRSGK